MSRRAAQPHLPPQQRPAAVPRGDVFTAPAAGRRLPVRSAPVATGGTRPAWLFVAAHGGTGARLLAELSWQRYEAARRDGNLAGPGYGMCAGRAWPDPVLEPTGDVVVVCRSSMRGLAWAQDAAAQHLAGHTPPLHVRGLVVIADGPGKPGRPRSAAAALLAGVYPAVWPVPWVADYQLLSRRPGEGCPPCHPAVADVLDDIRRSLLEGNPDAHLA